MRGQETVGFRSHTGFATELVSSSPENFATLSRHSSEFAWISGIVSRERKSGLTAAPGMIGIGDDAAAVPTGNCGRVLVATDTILEGVHFNADASPSSIGHKAIAVNLSDIAAMGGVPTAATVAISAPASWSRERLDELMIGLQQTAHAFEVAIVGGDTTSWDGALAVTVTVLGVPGPRGVISRSGGRAGDLLFVTGPLGGSILGRHLTFTPRVREALELAERVDVRAMIDLSDGLASDLRHLAAASGCRAVIDHAKIPIRSELGDLAVERALTDGEDFELLFAAPPESRSQAPAFCTEVGQLESGSGVFLHSGDSETELKSCGYSHAVESSQDD